MNFYRWVQIACWVLLSFSSVGFQIRNWKWGDTHSRAHHRITIFLIGCWAIGVLGGSWAMFKEFTKTEKTPRLVFYLNGLRLSESNHVVLPFTTNSQELSFSVLNDGNWPLDGLQLTISMPKNLTVLSAEGWRRSGRVTFSEYSAEPSNDQSYFNDFATIIGSKDMGTFQPISVLPTSPQKVTQIEIRGSAKNAPTTQASVWIRFASGITKPFLSKQP